MAARLVEENEKHGIEYRDFDIQLDQCGQAINGFSKVDGLGVEIDFFDFGVGSHHGGLAPEGIGSTASGIKLIALNVGFMEHLQISRMGTTYLYANSPHAYKRRCWLWGQAMG